MPPLLSLLAVALQAGAAVIPPGPSGEKVAESLRAVDMLPLTPQSGFEAGMIFFKGRPILPPYAFSWNGDALLVNEVQVSPTPYQAYLERAEQGEVSAVAQSLQDPARTIQRMLRAGSPKKAVELYLGSRPGVSAVGWRSDSIPTFSIALHGRSFPASIDLPAEDGRDPKIIIGRRVRLTRAQREKKVQNLMDSLRAERAAIFYDAPHWDSKVLYQKLLAAVPPIMDAPALDRSVRLSRLTAACSGNGEIAQDILANYLPEEWAMAAAYAARKSEMSR